MSNTSPLKAVEPSHSDDFARLRQATQAVDMKPDFPAFEDHSLMDHVIAAEQDVDRNVSARADAQRRRDLTVNNYKIKRGKLREMFELMKKELESEEQAVLKELDRYLRVSDLVVTAAQKKLEILTAERRNPQ